MTEAKIQATPSAGAIVAIIRGAIESDDEWRSLLSMNDAQLSKIRGAELAMVLSDVRRRRE